MYPVLILREEAVCLAILIFLGFTARTYLMGKDSRSFRLIITFAFIHIIFDIITALTVNNLETVPLWLNDACHIIFYMSAILFSCCIFVYTVKVCYPKTGKGLFIAAGLLPVVYLLTLPWLSIDYIAVNGTNSSTGSAAYVGYGVAFLYFASALILIFVNFKELQKSFKLALLPVILFLIAAETAQAVHRELLFTGGAVTIVTVGFFFSLENPVRVMEQKVITDALTGVGSRHAYEQELQLMERRYAENPELKYCFAYCDINDLREINTLYGHQEGDRYITLVATSLIKYLKNAEHIYRIGGDEFLCVYLEVDEETVKKELNSAAKHISSETGEPCYVRGISAGYAISGPEYKTLEVVVKAADYVMFRRKTEIKGGSTFIDGAEGIRLNPTGLTDRVFNAMCRSNDRSYPFITNLETGVTRISPAWVEYFGMSGEFHADFNSTWLEYIHPDDRQAFINDIAATVNGKQQYHNADYRAINPAGEYVSCSCHGALYRGADGAPDIFAGYLVNHGVPETVDPVTGLRNVNVLDEIMTRLISEHGEAIILKLHVNNFGRINMLYGYSTGDELRRKLAETFIRELGDDGEAFCQGSTDFTILFNTTDREKVSEFYSRISSEVTSGKIEGNQTIPLGLSGGAVELKSDSRMTRQEIRSSLIFAVEESAYSEHNELVFFNEMWQRENSCDIEYLRKIHSDAVEGGKNFFFRYQPICDTVTGRIESAEALIRWSAPGYGECTPAGFINFLENDPCYYELAFVMLREAAETAAEIRKTIPDFSININITVFQLQREDFIPRILEILDSFELPPSAFVLELRERCKELDIEYLKRRTAALRDKGLRVALDDMGSGYSTLNLLLNVHADEIKLDCDFVRGMMTDKYYRMFARTLADGSGPESFRLCFEGIEDENMLELIRGYGESSCQGNMFGKPLLFDELKNKLSEEA